MYLGCESWILREVLIDKLDIFARRYYCIMLGTKQSRDHGTNESLYHLTDQEPVRERQLLSSKVTSFACRLSSPPTALSSMIHRL